PKFLLTTTNHNRCRFNPNLYADGKVCLSLLGTWSGEPWSPSTSTLLQVLVSIHSLIMTDSPFYNEPGHSPGSDGPSSLRYNAQIRAATMRYAMRDAMRSSDSAFRDVDIICLDDDDDDDDVIAVDEPTTKPGKKKGSSSADAIEL
ncbi:hypothetical protein TrRE_jg9483, partial [Triparma retinervis]